VLPAIHIDVEISKESKWLPPSITAIVGEVRGLQRVIENVVKVCPQRGCYALSESELLVHSQVHFPNPGPDQQVTLRDLRIVKDRELISSKGESRISCDCTCFRLPCFAFS